MTAVPSLGGGPSTLPATYGSLHLTPQEVATFVGNSYHQGLNWSTDLGTLGVSNQQAIEALSQAGWSASKISSYRKNPSEVQKILDQLGQSTVIPPLGDVGAALSGEAAGTGAAEGAAASGAAEGASAGALASGANLAANLAKWGGTGVAIAGIWQWLTTASHWLRILEYVGGAILVYMGIRALTGVGPDVSDVAKVVK